MTKWIAFARRSPGGVVRLAAASVVLVSLSALALEAQQPASTEPRFTLGVLPYLGVSTTPREQRLPAAPLAGIRLTGNVWTRVSSGMRVATYLGVEGATLAVNESRTDCPSGPCGGQTEIKMSYLATAYGGVKTDVLGLPHFFVFFGRAFPRAFSQFNPTTRAYEGNTFVTWGFGGGLVVAAGNVPVHLEGRFRRDRRFDPVEDDAFEFILGVPLGYR